MTTLPAGTADAALAATLARHGSDRHALLQMLVELQAAIGWLPRHLLATLADALALPLAEVEGVAGFYRFLHLQPVGRWRLLFSDNVTDRHAGSGALMTALCARLGLPPGDLRHDGRVSVATTSCIGLADQGPSLLVNHRRVITRLDAARIEAIADRIEADAPLDTWPGDWFQVDEPVRRADVLLGPAPAPGEALHAALARGADGMLAELQASRLRGRGGTRRWLTSSDGPWSARPMHEVVATLTRPSSRTAPGATPRRAHSAAISSWLPAWRSVTLSLNSSRQRPTGCRCRKR